MFDFKAIKYRNIYLLVEDSEQKLYIKQIISPKGEKYLL